MGGIFTAEDAWEKIFAGASLVQLYTGLIYEGPNIAHEINEGLANILAREGFANLMRQWGAGQRSWQTRDIAGDKILAPLGAGCL